MSTNAAEQSVVLDGRIRIASAVRAHYAAAGFSASALAREIGMSQSKMSRRTTGAEPFDSDELSAIAHVLEVDIVDLIAGTNLPTRPMRVGGGRGIRNLYLLDVGAEGIQPPALTVKTRNSGDEVADVVILADRRALKDAARVSA